MGFNWACSAYYLENKCLFQIKQIVAYTSILDGAAKQCFRKGALLAIKHIECHNDLLKLAAYPRQPKE